MFSSFRYWTFHHTVLVYSHYLSFISFIYSNICWRSYCPFPTLWVEDACIQTSILEMFLHKLLAKKGQYQNSSCQCLTSFSFSTVFTSNSALGFTSTSLLREVNQVSVCKIGFITYEFRVKILLFISSFSRAAFSELQWSYDLMYCIIYTFFIRTVAFQGKHLRN